MTRLRPRSKLVFNKHNSEKMRISEPVLRHTTSLHPLQNGNSSPSGNGSSPTIAPAVHHSGEDPVRVFLKGKSFPQKRPTTLPSEVNETSLKKLAEADVWKEVFRICEKSFQLGFAPEQLNQFRLAQIVSLFRLRTYEFAQEDLQKSPRDGPFTLHIFQALLPHLQKEANTQLALDRLYTLLDRVRKIIKLLENGDPIPDVLTYDGVSDCAVWKGREKRIIFTIINVHLDQSKYDLALEWMEHLCQEFPKDPQLYSLKGCMFLQIGMLKPAEEAFHVVESLLSQDSVTALINKGYLSFANGKFDIAFEHFASVLQRDPFNVSAANNRAICLLYKENLTKAIELLEEFIRQDPNQTLDEVLVFNLCTLYELEGDGNQEKKHVINALVRRFKGDDFPSSALKLSS